MNLVPKEMPSEYLNSLSGGSAIIDATKETQEHLQIKEAKSRFETEMFRFILALPTVDVDDPDLPDRACAFCEVDYDADYTVAKGETPVQLPCGHVYGHKCIFRWLSPWEEARTMCPICKVECPCETGETLLATVPFGWFDLSDKNFLRQRLEGRKSIGPSTKCLGSEVLSPPDTDHQEERPVTDENDQSILQSPTKDMEHIGESLEVVTHGPNRCFNVARAAIKVIDLLGKRRGM